MKKIMFFITMLLFTVVVAACQNGEKTTKPATTTKAEPVVVKLAHWGIGTEEENNLLRRRVTRFNETHEDIKIEIMVSEGGWDEWLTTKAAAGEMPDVFMVNNVPDAAIKGWAANLADIVKADPEWFDIPESLRATITYDKAVFAIPAGYHWLGYFANLTLFENANVTTDFSTYEYSVEEFFGAITKAKNISGANSKVGLDASGEIVNWLPSSLDETGKIQHFLWDGEKFAYTSQEMTDTIAKAVALIENGETFNAYSDQVPAGSPEGTVSEREELFGTTNWNQVFANGRVGFRWGATWDAAWYATNIDDDFDHDFVGLPNNRVVGVSDYLCISKTSKNKQAAYEVAKYITFGMQGNLDAFDIIEEAKADGKVFTMSGLPINERRAITDKWFETYPQPGFKAIYEKIKGGSYTVIFEGNKFVPGFGDARWNYNTGIDARISRPNAAEGATLSIGDLVYDAAQNAISWSDHMTQELANKINAKLKEAQDALKAVK